MRVVVIFTIALVVLGAFGAAAKKPVDPVQGSKGLLDCTGALEVFCGDVRLATGYTVHAFVERETLRPARVLPELVEKCSAAGPTGTRRRDR